MSLNDLLFEDIRPTLLAAGELALTVTDTAQPLFAVSTPCTLVLLCAPCNAAGVATNTKPFFIGTATSQPKPVLATDQQGVYIRVKDAANLYVKGLQAEKVCYLVFGA